MPSMVSGYNLDWHYDRQSSILRLQRDNSFRFCNLDLCRNWAVFFASKEAYQIEHICPNHLALKIKRSHGLSDNFPIQQYVGLYWK